LRGDVHGEGLVERAGREGEGRMGVRGEEVEEGELRVHSLDGHPRWTCAWRWVVLANETEAGREGDEEQGAKQATRDSGLRLLTDGLSRLAPLRRARRAESLIGARRMASNDTR
jgi:hypothetical protein